MRAGARELNLEEYWYSRHRRSTPLTTPRDSVRIKLLVDSECCDTLRLAFLGAWIHEKSNNIREPIVLRP